MNQKIASMEKFFRLELNLKRLKIPDVSPKCTDAGTVHRLTEADIDVFTAAHRDRELVQARLDEGHIAYWLEIDEACVAAMWVATDRYYVWDIRSDILLPSDSVYFFDMFTVPEFRRKGLMKKCKVKCFEALKEKGVRNAYALIRTDNIAGNIMTDREGYESLGLVSLLQIPPVRKYMIRVAGGKRRHMFQFMNMRTKPALLNVNELIFEREARNLSAVTISNRGEM